MARSMLLRNGFQWAMTVSLLLGYQASAWAGCNNLFGLCHLGCYSKKRCCQVPCPTVCNEACYGFFPTQWQPWPCATHGAVVTPPIPAPEPLPAPKTEEKKMPAISMRR